MMNADFTMGKREILSPVTDNTSTELQDSFEISPEDFDLVAGGWGWPSVDDVVGAAHHVVDFVKKIYQPEPFPTPRPCPTPRPFPTPGPWF
jgi:hypothetical protein